MDMMQKSVHDLVVEAEKEAHGAAFAGTAMAMALRDNEMLRSIHEQHPQTLLNERERIEIAGIFARHAKKLRSLCRFRSSSTACDLRTMRRWMRSSRRRTGCATTL